MGFHPNHFCKTYSQTNGHMLTVSIPSINDELGFIDSYLHEYVVFERPGSGPEVYFDEECFIFNVSSLSYYHGLIDVLGHYLWLKSLFPNLTPVFLSTSETPNTEGFGSPHVYPFMRHILNLLGDPPIYVAENYRKLSFRRLRYVVNCEDYFMKHAFAPEIITQDQSNVPAYQYACAHHAREFLISTIRPLANMPKKIFLATTVEKINFVGMPGSIERAERQFDANDYLLLEKFFEEKNYKVIYPEQLSMQDQMAYIRHADVVVALTGSNSAHSLYTKDGGTFILANFNTRYRFPHSRLVKFCSSNPVIIFDEETKKHKNKTFTFEQWEKHFLDLGLEI